MGEEVVASYTSGVPRMKGYILAEFLFLTVIYVSILVGLKDTPYTVPADEFCPEGESGCSRPDLLGFQWASYAALAYCGLVGFWVWHVSRTPHTVLPSTPEGRMFGFLPEAEYLAACNFTFQLWDFFVSFTITEHCTPIMLAHHSLAAFASWSGLRYQYLHYYAVYFLGLSEFSSIFLVFVDLAKFFPPQPGTVFDLVVKVCGPCFAISFYTYRVVLWWKVSFLLFYDSYVVLTNGSAKKYRPGKVYVIYLFLISGLLLGFLQVYWAVLVAQAVMDAFV